MGAVALVVAVSLVSAAAVFSLQLLLEAIPN